MKTTSYGMFLHLARHHLELWCYWLLFVVCFVRVMCDWLVSLVQHCRCWFGKRAGIYTDYIYQGPMILVLLVGSCLGYAFMIVLIQLTHTHTHTHNVCERAKEGEGERERPNTVYALIYTHRSHFSRKMSFSNDITIHCSSRSSCLWRSYMHSYEHIYTREGAWKNVMW